MNEIVLTLNYTYSQNGDVHSKKIFNKKDKLVGEKRF